MYRNSRQLLTIWTGQYFTYNRKLSHMVPMCFSSSEVEITTVKASLEFSASRDPLYPLICNAIQNRFSRNNIDMLYFYTKLQVMAWQPHTMLAVRWRSSRRISLLFQTCIPRHQIIKEGDIQLGVVSANGMADVSITLLLKIVILLISSLVASPCDWLFQYLSC